ncbi:hypothetical protein PMIN02_005912 [Paraphaeosphaeria minitans]
MRPSASAVHPRERKAASARPETPISHAAIHIDGTCVAIVKRPGARLLQANPRLPVRLRRLNPAAHASRLFHRNTIVQLSPRGQTMYARDGILGSGGVCCGDDAAKEPARSTKSVACTSVVSPRHSARLQLI